MPPQRSTHRHRPGPVSPNHRWFPLSFPPPALAAQLGGSGARRRSVEPRDADADLVFNSYRSLVRVAKATLNILIGKAGVVSKVPVVGEPVATALRGVEAIQDDIAIKLINMFSDRANDLTAEANSLDATMTLAIHSYESIVV